LQSIVAFGLDLELATIRMINDMMKKYF